MKKRFKILSLLLSIVVGLSAIALAGGCGENGGSGGETTADLKVGLISDPHNTTATNWNGNLTRTFTFLKEQNLDAIVIAGDIVDKAFEANYKIYTDTLSKVFGENPPQMILTLGNHDFWKVHSVSSDKDEMYKLFEKSTGQNPNYHTTVKDYHFIGVSPDSGNLDYKGNIDWLKKEVASAAADSGDKPIFVVAHDNAANTTLSASSADLGKALKEYQQVILVSGHTHYACQDERTIYQENFTSIDLGATSYSCINEEYYGNIPLKTGQPDVFVRLLTISGKTMKIRRVSITTGETEKQEYEFKLPLKKEEFTYTSARAESAVAPEFKAGTELKISESGTKGTIKIAFASAECPTDMVYAYRIRIANVNNDKDKQIVYFATDFYKGVAKIKAENEYTVKGLKAGETYEITVTARESFEKWSTTPLKTTYTVPKN